MGNLLTFLCELVYGNIFELMPGFLFSKLCFLFGKHMVEYTPIRVTMLNISQFI